MSKPKSIQRDIVDMFYDDGLTNKEALEIEQQSRQEAVSITQAIASAHGKDLACNFLQEGKDYER